MVSLSNLVSAPGLSASVASSKPSSPWTNRVTSSAERIGHVLCWSLHFPLQLTYLLHAQESKCLEKSGYICVWHTEKILIELVRGQHGGGEPECTLLQLPELGAIALQEKGESQAVGPIGLQNPANEVGACSNVTPLIAAPNLDVDAFLLEQVEEVVTLKQLVRELGETHPLFRLKPPLHAPLRAMMSKESVKRRLEWEQGINYTEFSYKLLQGYDFLYLFEKEGVNVQIGGNDQWGNITIGTDLIRRILQADGAYGLTFPLLLNSDGTKFGKSGEGALWLSPSMLFPYKFYQHFFNVTDADVVRFLKALTFLSMEEIGELERKMQRPAEYVPNTAQRRLAEEVTRSSMGKKVWRRQ
ncbi:tyrosine--tRNA ligase [Sarracenia purpurea var. burkii]